MNRAENRHSRPVDLNLFRVHLPLPGWVSILHRVSGVLLFAAFPLGVWALAVSLADADGFARMRDAFAHPLGRMALLGLVWAFAHHFFAGLRHLALDMHQGVSLVRARQTSVAVLAATALVTVAAAWGLFA